MNSSRRCIVILFLFVCAELSAASERSTEQTQFDFWLGAWNVQNRKLKSDNTWSNSFTAEALIEPILDGRAMIEQWHYIAGAKTIGFSLRYYDSAAGRWIIALNWPGLQSQGFSYMEGRFRHGRRGVRFSHRNLGR